MEGILDILFPKKCVICGKGGVFVCDVCYVSLKKSRGKCPMCSRESHDWLHERCRESDLERLFSVFDYGDLKVAKLIKAVKYRLYKDVVGEVMERVVLDSEWGKVDLVVPIPLHRLRENWRGFNQAELIGREIAGRLNVEMEKVLRRVRETRPLAEIRGRKEREKEIEGVFEYVGGVEVKGKTVLLVDDVFTSGATMREAARCLKGVGASEVWGWVLAS